MVHYKEPFPVYRCLPLFCSGPTNASTFPQVELNDRIWRNAIVMAEPYFLYPTANSKSLVVWDMEKQHTLGRLEGHDNEINVVAAKGSFAISSQEDPVRARVWNLETMRCTATLPGGEDDTKTTAVCCMDGRALLGQRDGVIRLWDVAASDPVALADLEGHTSMVHDIKTTTAAGGMALSGSVDKTVRLWDLRTSSKCVRTMEGHSGGVLSEDMDGHCRTAVSGSMDKTVKLWDLGSGLCMETYEGHTNMTKAKGAAPGLVHHHISEYNCNIVCAWVVGSTRSILRADMASSCVPNSTIHRLFASSDFSTVAFCSVSESQLGLSVWR